MILYFVKRKQNKVMLFVKEIGLVTITLVGCATLYWYYKRSKDASIKKPSIGGHLNESSSSTCAPIPPCGYCRVEIHPPKECRMFDEFKKNCTKTNYRSTLKNNDLAGFCAAGVAVIITNLADGNNKYVLMIRETRADKFLLNFIGGKRESRGETPDETARREYSEEVGYDLDINLISHAELTNPIWMAQAKYALYFVDKTLMKLPDIETNSPLVWVNINDWDNLNQVLYHPFAVSMIGAIKSMA